MTSNGHHNNHRQGKEKSMGNYKLWELANRDGVMGLLPHVEEAVLALSESKYTGLGVRTPNEVGEPLARYIHGKLMQRARLLRPNDPTPSNSIYTHIAEPSPESRDLGQTWGDLNLYHMVEEAAGGVFSDKELHNLTSSLQWQFRVHRLVESGLGTGRAVYFLRPWPFDLEWRHQPKSKPDPKVEKRIEEEADQPVVVHRSSKVIVGELPDKITPDWAVSTVKRLAEAFDRLQDKYVHLESEYARLAEKVEELSRDEWAEATDELKKALA